MVLTIGTELSLSPPPAPGFTALLKQKSSTRTRTWVGRAERGWRVNPNVHARAASLAAECKPELHFTCSYLKACVHACAEHTAGQIMFFFRFVCMYLCMLD